MSAYEIPSERIALHFAKLNSTQDRVTCSRCRVSTHVDEMIYFEEGWRCVACVEAMRSVAARKETTE